MTAAQIYKVAIDAPLVGLFDYLPIEGEPPAMPGCRVQVTFGRRRQVGVVMAVEASSELPASRLRKIHRVLDAQPVFDATLLRLIRWAADYYRYPVGEVAAAALPKRLREGESADIERQGLRLTRDGRELPPGSLARARRQQELIDLLTEHGEGVEYASLRKVRPALANASKRLIEKGLVETFIERQSPVEDFSDVAVARGPVLTAEQDAAVERINSAAGFEAFALYGVTGSGKTEVYLTTIARCLGAGKQCLVLVPEIALTPQLVARFEKRFATPIVTLHSGLPASTRLAGWRAARDGRAAVVIGTRSAVFTPLQRPGLIVVDEEHDSSFKQQEGFRYSGRDLAVFRARECNIPIILGSATPSFETLHNVAARRYARLDLPQRPGGSRPPSIRLVDLRTDPCNEGLSTTLNLAITRHLDQGGQVMLFLNRRGFAPAWFCSGCGWLADCRRCDAHMTFHQRDQRLRCHHCGAQTPPPVQCPECNEPLKPVGQGTERIEDVLKRQFPAARVERLDRDTTRRRGALESVIDRMLARQTDILVGTQMLTKGHHFPDVSLVGIINADQGLFSTDFRASERLAQMLVQVSGRAGRAERKGEVLIQTSFPEHELLQRLIRDGYEAFYDSAIAERQEAGWPPYSYLALLRARGSSQGAPMNLLAAAADAARNGVQIAGIKILGPAQSPMSRRAGQYHAQLLLQADRRSDLNTLLQRIEGVVASAQREFRVRVSIDVDPIDLF